MFVSQQNPVIAVKPFQEAFAVHWLMTRRCNFDCSYCPDFYHDRSAEDHSLAKLQQAWLKIVDSTKHIDSIRYSVSLLGGEPTLNPDFIPFLKWLKQEYADQIVELGVITNGSANEKIYLEMIELCNWITFSTHSEFMSERKFFRNVLLTHKAAGSDCLIAVNIMDEPWQQERNQDYKNFLNKHGIRWYLHPIIDFGDSRDPLPAKKTQRINFYDKV